ncbi:discoidin domain-containing protein [Actinoplanes sp. NPDC049599]|uniref:discoidin domain-containing protein n=1 Tax=Actinoplanes sp. NPDC049599 TaxID=3363903 RepID=UPI003788CECC
MPNPAEQQPGDATGLPTRIPFAGPHPGTVGPDRPAPSVHTESPAQAAGRLPRTPLPRVTGIPRRAPATGAPAAPPVVAEPERAGRSGRSWVLPAAVAALILVAGGFWWSRDRAAPEAPRAAPAPALAPTMRITAPGTGASAGVGSDAPSAAASVAAPGRASSGGSPAAGGATRTVERTPVGAAANPSGRNLALGARATASSVEGSAWGPAYAVDNNTATRWSSGFSDPQWLTVDLGKSWEISEVLLRWENAHATAYRVELSTDGKKWKRVYGTDAGSGGDVTVQVPKLPARLVRVYGTARSTQYGYSLLEIEVR